MVRNLIVKGGPGTGARRYISFEIREASQDEWVCQYETILLNERSVYQALSNANAAWSTAKHEADVKSMYEHIAADCAEWGCN